MRHLFRVVLNESDALQRELVSSMHHKRLLNPELQPFMNVTMVLPGEKEKVYALRNVLEIRCPALLNDEGLIKKKKEKKGDAGLITVDYKAGLMSHAVLLQVLEWVYTDAIDVESLSILELLQLLKASRLFDAPRLVFLCEYELRRKLTVDSVFTVLKEASQLGMELTKSNFQAEVKDSGKNAFIKFLAPW